MSVDAVNARWDGFLAKIKQRFEGIMAESLQGCAALFQQSGGDPQAMSNAWTGMELRAKELGTKVENTWDEQVETALEDADASSAQEDAARAKGDALNEWMEVELERTRLKIYCDAARGMLQQGFAEQGELRCSQCGASVEHPFTFRSVNVNCPHCSAVVTIEPGTKARYAEALGTDPLSREASWDQWLAMRRAEQAMHAARNNTIELIQGYEAAQIEFWRAYLSARARLLPGVEKDFDADLRGRMQQFYQTLEFEKAWVKAGRPRAIP